MSACGGCCGTIYYNGTEETISDDDIENYDNNFETFFAQITEGGPRTTKSKMELFLTLDKGYILDMTRFLGL